MNSNEMFRWSKSLLLIAVFLSTLPYSLAQAQPWIVHGDGRLDEDVRAATVELSDGRSICSAVLIGANTALTAAHCVLEDRPRKLIFSPDATALGAPMRPVDRVALPPDLDRKRLVTLPRLKDLADIAVLHFTGELPPGYHPAALLSNSESIADGQAVMIAGFGVSDPSLNQSSGVLRQTQVRVLDRAYAATEIQLDASHGGSCYGDSGGPAFVRVDGRLAVLAIDNWGQGPCNQFSIYAAVAAHLDWISTTAYF